VSGLSAGLAGLAFHHFGLAVGQPDEAFRYLRALGYSDGNQVFDERQRVNLAMRHHPAMPDVEVIWPGQAPSPIDHLVKRMGTLIYHLCYACPDCAAAIAAIEAAGIETALVSPPTPAVLFDGREVSFHLVSGFGLIELLQCEPETA
jgi:hypothetical protein